ncbi:conserved hypothetical protein [Agrobacterium tumefaciens str. CFBP 5621]|nr:conserved hypothetical protein [Agrobacterium tumefaciens str. CFBP 5621]
MLNCFSPTAIMNGTFRHCVVHSVCAHDCVNPGTENPDHPPNSMLSRPFGTPPVLFDCFSPKTNVTVTALQFVDASVNQL